MSLDEFSWILGSKIAGGKSPKDIKVGFDRRHSHIAMDTPGDHETQIILFMA